MYFKKNYTKAIYAYDKALNYAKGMEDAPPFSVTFEQAYIALGKMHENGLGVEKNQIKAEEYYLRAGSRGDVVYENKVALKSWHEKNSK